MTSSTHPTANTLSFAGLIALAVAMGIGRFAFTPLLPMMQQDAGLGLAEGGWLASANYIGYLVGALTAARLPWTTSTQLKIGLAVVVATTALMGMSEQWAAWLLWRFAAGVTSAWVLVATSMLCLPRLAAMGASARGGLLFAGVGVGIALAGAVCMALGLLHVPSSQAWLLLAALALVGTWAAMPLWRPRSPAPAHAAPAAAAIDGGPSAPPSLLAHWKLVVGYTLFGFGYILPATFLPAQARLLVDDPAVFGLAWPLFGLAAALSTLATGHLTSVSRLRLWAVAQWIMAAGVVLPVLSSSLTAIVLAAVCVGSTFMVITMAGMQQAQLAGGQHARRLTAALTTAFATGQLAGPLFFSFTHIVFGADLDVALVIAAVGLVAGTALLTTPRADRRA